MYELPRHSNLLQRVISPYEILIFQNFDQPYPCKLHYRRPTEEALEVEFSSLLSAYWLSLKGEMVECSSVGLSQVSVCLSVRPASLCDLRHLYRIEINVSKSSLSQTDFDFFSIV